MGIEAEIVEQVRGRDRLERAEEIDDVLAEDAAGDEAAVLRIIFGAEIVVVGGPGLEAGVADGDVAGNRVGVGGEFDVVFRDGGVGDDVGKIGAAIGLGVGGAELEFLGREVSEMNARVVAVVGAVGRVGALAADEPQLLHRAGEAGLRFADTLVGGVAGKGAVRIAQPDGGGFVDGADAFVVGFFVAHAGEDREAIAEKARFGLCVETGDGFENLLGADDAALLFGDALGGGLGEDAGIFAPRIDGAVVGEPRQVIEAEIVRAVLVNLADERCGREISSRGCVGEGAVVGAAVAILRTVAAADLDVAGDAEEVVGAAEVEVVAEDVLFVIAIVGLGGGVQPVVVDIVEIDLAVGVVVGAGGGGAHRGDTLECDAHRVNERSGE